MWDTGRTDDRGCTRIGYQLREHDGRRSETLFRGTDFCPSPMHADDADETVAALLGFLTLRPGDTDDEYFDKYTARQLQFCEQHAESLGAECSARFPEE